MEVSYYNLSGGINQALTKTELGINTKNLYWTDAENVEILKNRGISKQKGNTLLLELEEQEKITGLFEMSSKDKIKLLITTELGKIYIYDEKKSHKTLVEKVLTGKKPVFAEFLDGVLILSESDGLFYIKNNENYDVIECELKDAKENLVTNGVVTVYKGRVWVGKDATIYYSALGTYNDFTTEDDAGYIRDFHTDTDGITAIMPYRDYLAIYKKDTVYLLTGTSPDNFTITPFLNKGTQARGSIINVDNKQYFLSNGIYALEQTGDLNQIQLGAEISPKIKAEFSKFNKTCIEDTFCLHYEDKNQIWYFFPYTDDNYFHTIWINDYINKAWYKRIVPQDITTAGIYNGNILTADNQGRVYIEDYGLTFNGEAVKFMWKSPFLAIGSAHKRKTIDEFYFILDSEYDNDFDFSVYKDYDGEYSDDTEHIYSVQMNHLIWANDEMSEKLPCNWAKDEETVPIWSVSQDVIEKAEISESNYSIQLCVSGSQKTQSCGIIGLQFREIYNDD